jgi:hypothetical protein
MLICLTRAILGVGYGRIRLGIVLRRLLHIA